MHNDMVGSRCNEKIDQGSINEKVRMDVEEDRLSRLPDDVIHTILSLISLREAIKTCVLSSRWRFMWTSMTCLSFSSREFFPEFVDKVLYRRNDELQLSSLKLNLPMKVNDECVKRVMDYASSHNIQQLSIIAGHSATSKHIVRALSSFKAPLPALTRLHLHLDDIKLYNDKFSGLISKCPNLKHFSLRRCKVRGNVLNICHPRLSNLTLKEDASQGLECLEVVAPQLKILTLIDCCHGETQCLISAPGLTSLVIKGIYPFQLIAKEGGFPCLERVDVCFFEPHLRDAARPKLVSLIRQLHNVKFLTLNLKILEVLSSSVEPISRQPSANINILKFLTSLPPTAYMEVQPLTGMKNNLQDNFPSAIVTMISSEEIRAMRDIVSAKQVIIELRLLLRKCELRQMVFVSMEIYPRDLDAAVVTTLQRLEGLLTGLPLSKSLAMQPIYSSVCEEADVVTKKIFECTNMATSNIKQAKLLISRILRK